MMRNSLKNIENIRSKQVSLSGEFKKVTTKIVNSDVEKADFVSSDRLLWSN